MSFLATFAAAAIVGSTISLHATEPCEPLVGNMELMSLKRNGGALSVPTPPTRFYYVTYAFNGVYGFELDNPDDDSTVTVYVERMP